MIPGNKKDYYYFTFSFTVEVLVKRRAYIIVALVSKIVKIETQRV